MQLSFLGIDLGTSAVKLLLMAEDGKVLQTVSQEYPVYYPQAGWAEQDPEEWWKATSEGIRKILATTAAARDPVQSIGLSGQMHGLVLLDGESRILRPALLWCDQRTQAECDFITEQLGSKLSEYTANKALTGFTAPKVLWVKHNQPAIYRQIEHILLPKDYIRWRLTGEYATDVSDASGTLFFDVAQRQWSMEMVDFLGLPATVLPTCYESYEITGYITGQAAAATGLNKRLPVVGGGGDQASGAVGTGVVKAGTVSVALGTSGVVFACQDTHSVDDKNRLHSFCHANGKWHVMGVMLSAASCLKWWVEKVCRLDGSGFTPVLNEAAAIPAGSQGLIYLPYLLGERTPYSDPNARGTFTGLTMSHGRAHMTKAILEGVAFGLRDSLEIIREQHIPIQEVRVSGGGARSILWRQILANVLDLPVCVVNSVEGPAFGAAILAAVGAGAFADVGKACESMTHTMEQTDPVAADVDCYHAIYPIYHQLYGHLRETFGQLGKL